MCCVGPVQFDAIQRILAMPLPQPEQIPFLWMAPIEATPARHVKAQRGGCEPYPKVHISESTGHRVSAMI